MTQDDESSKEGAAGGQATTQETNTTLILKKGEVLGTGQVQPVKGSGAVQGQK